MQELSLDEISLLEEMKSNCLKKGQYIDDKAKDKFKLLCHLEDFGIVYYELLDVIKELKEYIEKYEVINGYYDSNYDGENDTYSHDLVKEDILEILDKVKSNENEI